MSLLRYSPAAMLLLAVSPARADDGGAIIVSAMREPVDATRVANAITVLDAATIARDQPLAVTDILARTPALSVVRNGGYGAATSLRIRGASSAQTVLVIDGMRVADTTATDGGYAFGQLFADDIDRIEILRGSQSILWGSGAIGGVINVTTRRPTRPLEGDVAFEGGSNQTLSAHAGLGGTGSLVDWRLSGSTFTTEGIPTLAAGTVPNGYTRKAASGTATVHLSPDVSLDLRGNWSDGRTSYSDAFTLPGAIYPDNTGINRQWSAYAGLNVSALGGRWKNRLAVVENETVTRDLTPALTPPLTFEGHGRIRRFEYQATFALSRAIDLVAGAEREESRMAVGSPYDNVPFAMVPHTNAINSVYAQARLIPVTGLTLSGGVRYDDNRRFGGNTVFSAGGAYTPDGGVTVLRASYDEAFKAPALYQLYSDYGVDTLKPERAHSWEVGVERSLWHASANRSLTLGATWYTRNSDNLIDFAYCPFAGPTPAVCYIPGTTVTRFGYYANVDKAHAHGFELTGSARLGPVFADGNYAIVVSQDRTPGAATFGQQLLRTPRHLANATVGLDWPRAITTSVALRWSGASLDSTYSGIVLAAYAVVDARIEWRLREGLSLYGRVENLGDRHYQTAAGYNSFGRTGMIGLRGHF